MDSGYGDAARIRQPQRVFNLAACDRVQKAKYLNRKPRTGLPSGALVQFFFKVTLLADI